MSDAPFRSSSLLPQKRSRQAAASPGDADAAAPAPRRAKSVSDVRYRDSAASKAGTSTSTSTSGSSSRAGGKGKAKATSSVSAGGLGAVGAADGWKGDMFGRFVEKALRDVEDLGDSTTYDELVAQLRPAAPHASGSSSSSAALQPSLIHPLLVALTTHASLLSSTAHRALIEALIHFPWSTADAGFVETYMRFVGVLVSLRMEWLGEVVKRCVKGLKFQPHFQQLLPPSSSSSAPPLTRGSLYTRQHTLLARLLALIPTLPSLLLPLLLASFPPKREPRIAHTVWVRNVLRVSGYCPTVGERVWGAVLGRALQMDVEIQVEWDELEDADDDDAFSDGSADSDDDAEDPFEKLIEVALVDPDADDVQPADDDDDDVLAVADSDSDSDASLDDDDRSESDEARRKRLKGIKEMAGKLDAVLAETFAFFAAAQDASASSASSASSSAGASSVLLPPGGGQLPLVLNALPTPAPSRSSTPLTPAASAQQLAKQRQHQFSTLLSIFDTLILRTFKSRYTQFLLFWFASLSAPFTEDFLGLLVSKALFERDQPEVVRKAAASYVGSFVSRAVWVDGPQVRRVVDLLCQFLEAQLEVVRLRPDLLGQFTKAGQRSGGLGVFYAVAQAVFLIFCFRWRDLREDEDELEMDDDGADEDAGAGGKGHWVEGLDVLERVVLSSFNPLKVCSPNVVTQFARIAHESGFLFVYHIIASNNRTAVSASGGGGGSGASLLPGGGSLTSSLHHHSALAAGKLPTPTPRQERDSSRPEAVEEADLDSFFPFDPFRLPASSRFIDNIYRSWEGAGDSDSDDDDDGDEDDEDERNDTFTEEPLGARSIPASRRRLRLSADEGELAELGRSFEQGLSMSVSPGMGLAGRMGVVA